MPRLTEVFKICEATPNKPSHHAGHKFKREFGFDTAYDPNDPDADDMKGDIESLFTTGAHEVWVDPNGPGGGNPAWFVGTDNEKDADGFEHWLADNEIFWTDEAGETWETDQHGNYWTDHPRGKAWKGTLAKTAADMGDEVEDF